MDVSGIIPNFSLPNTSFLTIGVIWSFAKMLLWIGVAWLVATIFLKYRYIVVTRVQRGTGQKIKINLAKKVVEKDGMIKLKILAKKTKIPFPQNDFVYPALMGFEFVEFYADPGDSLHPVKFGFLEGDNFLYPVEQDSRSWIIQGTKETMQIYNKQSWLTQYGNILSMGILCCTFIITLVLCFKQVDKANAVAQQAMSIGGQLLSGIKAPPIV